MEYTPRPFLLDTEDAITLLIGDAPEGARAIMRRRMKQWAYEGRIRNHGASGKGQALWDLYELRAIAIRRNLV